MKRTSCIVWRLDNCPIFQGLTQGVDKDMMRNFKGDKSVVRTLLRRSWHGASWWSPRAKIKVKVVAKISWNWLLNGLHNLVKIRFLLDTLERSIFANFWEIVCHQHWFQKQNFDWQQEQLLRWWIKILAEKKWEFASYLCFFKKGFFL